MPGLKRAAAVGCMALGGVMTATFLGEATDFLKRHDVRLVALRQLRLEPGVSPGGFRGRLRGPPGR